MESSNGHDYVAVFSATESQRASLDVTVYNKEHAYRFSVDDVAIDKPTTVPFAPYRSAPTMFENPSTEPLLARDVEPSHNSTMTHCAPDRAQIPSVASVLKPRFPRSAEVAATLREIVAESGAVTTVITPVLRSDIIVPQCAEPFAYARTLHVVSPNYPLVAADHSVTGNARVKVTLDDAGTVIDARIFSSSGSPALDDAAMKAARATTYAPDTFLCRPSGGSYIFRADFVRGR